MSDYFKRIINNSGGLKSPPLMELSRPLVVPHGRILMGPGPSNCSPRVLNSLGNPVIGHMHPETFKIMDDIKEGLKYAFQTNNKLTLAISASGHSGMEACLDNLLEPGETILIVNAGIWGERAADMATRIGSHVEMLKTELGTIFTLDQLEIAIKKYKPEVVFLVHSESSTGLKQPLPGIGSIVQNYGGLLIVDTVASLGGEPFFMDAWKIDAVYTGSQKVLGAPPGLCPISFSDRAVKKLLSRKTKVPVFYWDMILLGNYWNCFNETKRNYHHTISTTLLYGLRESLSLLAEEGLEASWIRHSIVSKILYEGLEKRGFKFFVKNPLHRLVTVTAIILPSGIDANIIARRILDKWNIEISGGLGPTFGKILRIGIMGINATAKHVDLVLNALDEALDYSRTQSRL